MRDQQTHSLLRIVSSLEDALNNTSIILQFQSGTRRLLFPGDAQIENWSYCPHVDLADGRRPCGPTSARSTSTRSATTAAGTPVRAASSRSGNPTPGRSSSMMSTLPDVHGETEATAVPRATLVTALEGLGALYRTDKLAVTEMSTAVTASTRNRLSFTPVG